MSDDREMEFDGITMIIMLTEGNLTASSTVTVNANAIKDMDHLAAIATGSAVAAMVQLNDPARVLGGGSS